MLDMKLHNLLSERKSAILKRWFDVILETYPADTASFLRKQKKPFANPVGSMIFQGLESLFEKFLQGMDFDTAPTFLDNIIRIRAVQDFTPSQALVFIFLLKKVIIEELKNESRKHQLFEELLTLESKIDNLALLSFDVYMKCREKIYELKADELQSWTFRQLQRANQIYDTYKQEHNLKDRNIETKGRKEAVK